MRLSGRCWLKNTCCLSSMEPSFRCPYAFLQATTHFAFVPECSQDTGAWQILHLPDRGHKHHGPDGSTNRRGGWITNNLFWNADLVFFWTRARLWARLCSVSTRPRAAGVKVGLGM